MKRVTLSTGTTLVVKDEQGDKLAEALAAGTAYVRLNGGFYKATTVLAIEPVHMPGGTMPKLAAPATELTDAERAHNIERVRDMKQKFLNSTKPPTS